MHLHALGIVREARSRINCNHGISIDARRQRARLTNAGLDLTLPRGTLKMLHVVSARDLVMVSAQDFSPPLLPQVSSFWRFECLPLAVLHFPVLHFSCLCR